MGNSQFILKLVAVIWMLLLFAITVTALVFNTERLSTPLHAVWPLMRIDQILFFVVKILVGLVVLVVVFVIHRKVQTINDQFNIRSEVKYLSFMVLFVIATSVIALLLLRFTSIPLYEFQTIVYTFDVAFICSSCYVQFKWMLKYLLFNMKSDEKPVKMPLSMAQVLCEKISFESFMRHCVDELSVESLLFLVEIAQFKETLSSCNASDPYSAFLSLNMKSTNFRELLMRNCHQPTGNNPIPCKSPSFGSSPTSSHNDRSIKLLFRKFKEDVDDDGENQADEEVPDPSIFPEQLGTKIKAGFVDAEQFKLFQQSILDRKWLPLSAHLHVLSIQRHVHKSALHHSMLTKGSIKSRSLRNLRSVQQSETSVYLEMVNDNSNSLDRTQSGPKLTKLAAAGQKDSKLSASKMCKTKSASSVASLSLTPTTSSSVSKQRKQKKPKKLKKQKSLDEQSMTTSSSSCASSASRSRQAEGFLSATLKIGQLSSSRSRSKSSPTARPVITSEDIRDVAVFLYEKYIAVDSDLCINIAWDTRQTLDAFFRLPSKQMFEFIVTKSGGTQDKSPQCPAVIDEQLLINTYLYHVFDVAFEEIWVLLRKDTFKRFVKSEAYQKLVHVMQLQNEEEKQIEVVYSSNE
eukprot:CAMPEP_0197033418 /NCGR_PEP_ID=MMETSP1384-20130603/11833_1 /TAXON_ID=29189 /ORGANISM="Ammonia sp." /LENGTH=631 /DNA_ID=CAMNT_0042463223 /DNA_START=580 /DNA_END=2475 /DNA_ORIENTATION=+